MDNNSDFRILLMPNLQKIKSILPRNIFSLRNVIPEWIEFISYVDSLNLVHFFDFSEVKSQPQIFQDLDAIVILDTQDYGDLRIFVESTLNLGNMRFPPVFFASIIARSLLSEIFGLALKSDIEKILDNGNKNHKPIIFKMTHPGDMGTYLEKIQKVVSNFYLEPTEIEKNRPLVEKFVTEVFIPKIRNASPSIPSKFLFGTDSPIYCGNCGFQVSNSLLSELLHQSSINCPHCRIGLIDGPLEFLKDVKEKARELALQNMDLLEIRENLEKLFRVKPSIFRLRNWIQDLSSGKIMLSIPKDESFLFSEKAKNVIRNLTKRKKTYRLLKYSVLELPGEIGFPKSRAIWRWAEKNQINMEEYDPFSILSEFPICCEIGISESLLQEMENFHYWDELLFPMVDLLEDFFEIFGGLEGILAHTKIKIISEREYSNLGISYDFSITNENQEEFVIFLPVNADLDVNYELNLLKPIFRYLFTHLKPEIAREIESFRDFCVSVRDLFPSDKWRFDTKTFFFECISEFYRIFQDLREHDKFQSNFLDFLEKNTPSIQTNPLDIRWISQIQKYLKSSQVPFSFRNDFSQQFQKFLGYLRNLPKVLFLLFDINDDLYIKQRIHRLEPISSVLKNKISDLVHEIEEPRIHKLISMSVNPVDYQNIILDCPRELKCAILKLLTNYDIQNEINPDIFERKRLEKSEQPENQIDFQEKTEKDWVDRKELVSDYVELSNEMTRAAETKSYEVFESGIEKICNQTQVMEGVIDFDLLRLKAWTLDSLKNGKPFEFLEKIHEKYEFFKELVDSRRIQSKQTDIFQLEILELESKEDLQFLQLYSKESKELSRKLVSSVIQEIQQFLTYLKTLKSVEKLEDGRKNLSEPIKKNLKKRLMEYLSLNDSEKGAGIEELENLLDMNTDALFEFLNPIISDTYLIMLYFPNNQYRLYLGNSDYLSNTRFSSILRLNTLEADRVKNDEYTKELLNNLEEERKQIHDRLIPIRVYNLEALPHTNSVYGYAEKIIGEKLRELLPIGEHRREKIFEDLSESEKKELSLGIQRIQGEIERLKPTSVPTISKPLNLEQIYNYLEQADEIPSISLFWLLEEERNQNPSLEILEIWSFYHLPLSELELEMLFETKMKEKNTINLHLKSLPEGYQKICNYIKEKTEQSLPQEQLLNSCIQLYRLLCQGIFLPDDIIQKEDQWCGVVEKKIRLEGKLQVRLGIVPDEEVDSSVLVLLFKILLKLHKKGIFPRTHFTQKKSRKGTETHGNELNFVDVIVSDDFALNWIEVIDFDDGLPIEKWNEATDDQRRSIIDLIQRAVTDVVSLHPEGEYLHTNRFYFVRSGIPHNLHEGGPAKNVLREPETLDEETEIRKNDIYLLIDSFFPVGHIGDDENIQLLYHEMGHTISDHFQNRHTDRLSTFPNLLYANIEETRLLDYFPSEKVGNALEFFSELIAILGEIYNYCCENDGFTGSFLEFISTLNQAVITRNYLDFPNALAIGQFSWISEINNTPLLRRDFIEYLGMLQNLNAFTWYRLER